jgi:hypothetical protein
MDFLDCLEWIWKGQKPVALPDKDDPGFLLAYQAALARTAPVPKVSRVAPGSFEAVARGYLGSAKFKQLGPYTQAIYRRIIDDLCRKHGDKPVFRHGKRALAQSRCRTNAHHTAARRRALSKSRQARPYIWRFTSFGAAGGVAVRRKSPRGNYAMISPDLP